MYRLIGSPKTRAFRVLWMLEELDAEYEILAAMPQSEDIRIYNPGGKVPALVVEDQVIIDSAAIIQFLADRHQLFTFPAGTIERGQQDSLLQYVLDDMDSICWHAAKHSFVLPKELRIKEVKKSCSWDWDRSMMVLEQRLGDRDFLMGDDFTVPDIIAGHTAGWAKANEFSWPQGRITDYFTRVRSRPAFERAWKIREES